jgi:hypothetical protein
MSNADLLTITVERRRVAIAVFSGLHLDYHQVRELSAGEDKAARTTQAFVTWATNQFRPARIAIQTPPPLSAHRRLTLHAIVRGTLVSHLSPRTELDPATLREYLAAPPLRTKTQLRRVAPRLWPKLRRGSQPSVCDAALIGLHLQMLDLLSDK